jgi:hypothetical protein
VIDAVYRAESRRVLATLIRLLGGFELAEEALHEAFAAAVEQWPREGMPANIGNIKPLFTGPLFTAHPPAQSPASPAGRRPTLQGTDRTGAG